MSTGLKRKQGLGSNIAVERARRVLAGVPGREELQASLSSLAESYSRLERKFAKTLLISDGYQLQVKELSLELERAASKLKQLQQLSLPICVHCRKVRLDDSYWQQIEIFLGENADILFSQAICPDCIKASHDALKGRAVGHPALPKPLARRPRSQHQTISSVEEEAVKDMRLLAEQAGEADQKLGARLNRFADLHAKLARRFAKTLSISDSYQSQLKDLNMRLELLARTDVLTGLANRWEMNHRLSVEHSRLTRHGAPFSIALGDLDHFKSINDTLGHSGGDHVLKAVARTLLENLRMEDLCARWGGEEFMILLPETDLSKAMATARKLTAKVRSLGPVWEGRAVDVSISFGVAEILPGMSLDQGISLADQALYRAKRLGRDQVAAAGE